MYSAIQTGGSLGMQTLDMCLKGLVAQGPDQPRERPREGEDPGKLLIPAPFRPRFARIPELRLGFKDGRTVP
ncbi:twitching motility protein PilT [Pseudomonas aeruginosa]|nr:twitching motility protein PilT [Pseudomonas aeruginosa]